MNKRSTDYSNSVKIHKYSVLAILILFFLLFGHSLLMLKNTIYGRPLFYQLEVFLLSLIILQLIKYAEVLPQKYTNFILLLIVAISLNMRLGVFYSSTDIMWDGWRHLEYIEKIIAHGRLSVSDFYNTYSNRPLMHLLIVILKLLTTLQIKNCFASIVCYQSISIIYVFLLARILKLNKKGQLLSCFLIAICPYHVQQGFLATPITLSLSFFPLFILIILNNTIKRTISNTIILIILIISGSFLHPIYMFIMILTVTLKIVIDLVIQGKSNLINIFVIMLVVFLIHLIYSWYIKQVVFSFTEWFSQGYMYGFMIQVSKPKTPFIANIWDNYGLGIFIALGLCGLLYSCFISNRSKKLLYISILAFGLLAFAFIVSIAKFDILLPYRWLSFSIIGLSLCSACGLTVYFLNNKKGEYICSVIILLLVINMFTSYVGKDNYPAEINLGFKAPYTRFLSSEVVALSKIRGIIAPDQKLIVDYLPYVTIFDTEKNQMVKNRVSNKSVDYFHNNLNLNDQKYMIVYRSYMNTNPIYFYQDRVQIYSNVSSRKLQTLNKELSCVYDVEKIKLLLN